MPATNVRVHQNQFERANVYTKKRPIWLQNKWSDHDLSIVAFEVSGRFIVRCLIWDDENEDDANDDDDDMNAS